jgi:hypothetical protein
VRAPRVASQNVDASAIVSLVTKIRPLSSTVDNGTFMDLVDVAITRSHITSDAYFDREYDHRTILSGHYSGVIIVIEYE